MLLYSNGYKSVSQSHEESRNKFPSHLLKFSLIREVAEWYPFSPILEDWAWE
jgi:hypothetical protein